MREYEQDDIVTLIKGGRARNEIKTQKDTLQIRIFLREDNVNNNNNNNNAAPCTCHYYKDCIINDFVSNRRY